MSERRSKRGAVQLHSPSAAEVPGPSNASATDGETGKATSAISGSRQLRAGQKPHDHTHKRYAGSDRRALRLHHAFGTQSDVDPVLIDETHVLHRSGRWLVSQQIDGTAGLSSMTFFYEFVHNLRCVTALCTSDNRKYLALCQVCEGEGSPPQMTIIHAQTRRAICVLTAALEGPLIGCSFSSDGKYVLAYSGAPEYVTVVWQWMEERPMGMHRSRTPLHRVCFNPTSPSLLSMCAPMRLARLNESGHFKEIEVTALKRYGANAIDHTWLAAKLLVFADASGTIRVIEDSALKQSFHRAELSPTVLCPLASGGFVLGCADGQVVVFQRPPERGDFAIASVVHGPTGQGPVRSLHVGQRERHVLVRCNEVCLLKLHEQLARARLTSSEDGLGEASGMSAEAGGTYAVLLRNAHSAKVVALACAVSKPLLVSCAEDLTLRVWDVHARTCQMVAQLAEAPLSLTVHPDGMQLVLGYENRLSFHHISMDTLLEWKSLPLQAGGRALQYAHGGHLLAASSGRAVVVFDSYSLARVANLTAHHGPVTSLSWAADDSAFTTGGADGMLYTWRGDGTMARIHECRMYKNAPVTSVSVISEPRTPLPVLEAADEDSGEPSSTADAASLRTGAMAGNAAAIAGSVSGVHAPEHTMIVVGGEVHNQQQQQQHANSTAATDEEEEIATPHAHAAPPRPSSVLRLVERTDEQFELPLPDSVLSTLTALHASRLVLVGSTIGSIFTVFVPNDDGQKLKLRGSAARPHFSAVTAMVASHNEEFIFTASADGSIFAFSRSEGAAAGAIADVAQYTDVQCVSREILERGAQELENLRFAHTELRREREVEIVRNAAKLRSELAERDRSHTEALTESERRLRALVAQHGTEQATLQARFAEYALEAERKWRAQQLHMEASLRAEMARHDDVSRALDEAHERADVERDEMEAALQQARLAHADAEEEHGQEVDEIKEEHLSALDSLYRSVAERQKQISDEYDATLVQERHEKTVLKESSELEIKEMKMHLSMAGKKLKKYEGEKDAMADAIRKKEKEASDAASEIAELQATIAQLRTEAERRERAREGVHKKLLEANASMQRLDSAKKLLEIRVKELEEVHEPMMVQLYDLKMTSSRLEAELVEEGEKRRTLETEVADVKAGKQRLSANVAKAERRAADAETAHQTTLSTIYTYIEQKAPWTTVAEWVRVRDKELLAQQERAGRPRVGADPDITHGQDKVHVELLRQREKLHTTIERLANELRREKEKSRAHAITLSTEAQRAHNELNDARRQMRELEQKLDLASKEIAQLETARMRPSAFKGSLPSSLGELPAGYIGLRMSATQPELRAPVGKGGVDQGKEGGHRPGTAPSPPPNVSPSVELSDQMERHLLENQKLREQLLHFTSKPPKKGGKRRPDSSLTMPLPPV